MKKFLALLIALILGLFSAVPAGADVTVNSIDTPEETKFVEWALSYSKRCRNYHGKLRMNNTFLRDVKHVARRVALAPLSLLIGTACAEEGFQTIKKTDLEYKIREFTGAERAYERSRRMAENATASRQLGNPAMKAAETFSQFTLMANHLTKKNVLLLGGKELFDEINTRKNKLDELKDELAVIRNDESLFAERREIEKEREAIKEEVKILKGALKELLENATTDETALIQAQADASFARFREAKEKPIVGRHITIVPKPILKSYKLMHFTEEQFVKQFKTYINRVNNAADEYNELLKNHEMYTDDEFKKEHDKLVKAFNDLVNVVEKFKVAGKKIRLEGRYAKVHNARQSQLTDVIGVPYGRTTDMIISMSHNVANVFSRNVETYLDMDDPIKAEQDIDKLKKSLVDIALLNGIDIETYSKTGKSRVINFKFWNANNSQLKVGKWVALSEGAYARAAEVGMAGMTEEEFDEVGTNGSDMLKWWSYATTPGAPLMYNGEPLTVNDVLVVKSITAIRKFRRVMVYNKDGTSELKDIEEIERSAFDGMLFFLVPIPSQQIRGGFAFKGFGLCCAYEDGTNMIDEIARREGRKIPDYIEDVDGVMRRWRDYKIICTEDAWKWASWKIGGTMNENGKIEGARQFTYAEYCERMNKLTEKYPTANMLYTARIADATEESKRKLTRQSTQQFILADETDIDELIAKSVRKVNKLSTHAGVIRKMAGLDKPEDQRTAFEHLIEVAPEILDHPFMKRAVEDMFHRQVAEAAVRPEVDGIYPYIAEDPVAFFKIVFWGENPNKAGFGYLKSSQVNIPDEDEGTQLYIVRYPNNYMCGQLKMNHNDDIYRCCGNVMVLSLDGGILVWADGDTDGDEMCVIKTPVVIKMMQEAKEFFRPPMVKFPHDKLNKMFVRGKEARAKALSNAIVIANKYGPAVGQNSNLATRFFHKAAIKYHEWRDLCNDPKADRKSRNKAEWVMRKQLDNAILAHIAAIIAIDLAKTGEMPAWLSANIDAVSSFAGDKMPWNQRFCKDNKAHPWYSEWDTCEESKDGVDRIARRVINATHAVGYKAPTGNDFDLDVLLGSKEGLVVNGSSGKLTAKELMKLEARNYRTKDTNTEGDDEFKMIERLQSDKVEDRVGGAELIRFLWRNQASLVYVLQKDDGDKIDNAQMQNAYIEFCHDLLINFGSFCSKNTHFAAKSEEIQQQSNIWKFVNMAFDESNGIGCKADEEEKFTKKASFALFVVKVFAYDLYLKECDRKGITERWVKPETTDNETTDVTTLTYDGSNDGNGYNVFEGDEVM